MLKKLKDWLIKKLGGYTHEEMGMFSVSAREGADRQARLEWQNLMSDEVHIVKEVPLHEADAAAQRGYEEYRKFLQSQWRDIAYKMLAEMMRRGNLNRQITTDEYNNTMEFFAQTWICTFKNRGGNYILLKCNEKTTKAKLPEEGA